MRKTIRTLLALLASGVLMFLAPALIWPKTESEKAERRTLRVWAAAEDSAVAGWLKGRAAAYEKSSGRRVYLRAASKEELLLIREEGSGLVAPDVIVGEGGQAVALRGFVAVIRDGDAALPTPAPTALLFSRPAPSPGPTETPPAEADFSLPGPILAPAALLDALPGCVLSDQPLAGLQSGQADCALLTAGEAAKLTAGYRAVPGTGVFLSVSAQALTPDGAAFAAFLGQAASQRALAAFGLYSPSLRLYDPQADALRSMIEASLDPAAPQKN